MEKMTAQDIRNVTFEKGLRGYQTVDVEAFLTQIAAQVEELEKEKEESEKKLHRMSQLVSDYQKDEDNLKAALLNAQRMGDNIIQEANTRAAQIIRDAEAQAQAVVGQTSVQMEQQKNEFARLQEEVGRFKSSILRLYRQHIESLSTLPEPATPVEKQPEDSETVPVEEPVQAPESAADEPQGNQPESLF